MHIDKSIEINAPVDQVYSKISDYNYWRPWSPWLVIEPEATTDIEEGGKAYSWKGERIGSGEMKITNEDVNKRIDMDLTFLAPWKSHAKVWFTFSGENGSTKVNWYMDSSIPFFMFWMKKMMTTLVGMDYERGLIMLKDYVELGSVAGQMETEGERDYPGCKYVGVNTTCAMDQLGVEMEKDFATLNEFMHSNDIQPVGEPFSQYHKWELAKGMANYTTGIPVSERPDNLPSNLEYGEIPATKVYSIKLTGPYRYIGNGWSLGQNLIRSKVFKGSRKIHPFESYGNNPQDTPENDLITRINFPLK